MNNNLSAYYVPTVVFKNDVNFLVKNFKKGEEAFVYERTDNLFQFDATQKILVITKGVMGNDILSLNLEDVDLKVKIVIPKFKIGDIVRISGWGDKMPGRRFRIWEYCWLGIDLWYRDGWSVATGMESGVLESNLVLDENQKSDEHVKYYDDLVKNKNPHLYSRVKHL